MALFSDDEVAGILQDTGDVVVYVVGDPANTATAQRDEVGEEVIDGNGSAVVGTETILRVPTASLPKLEKGAYLDVGGVQYRAADVRLVLDGLEADVVLTLAD